MKEKKDVTKFILIILLFSLLIVGCSKYSNNENDYKDASEVSSQNNTDSRNKEHEGAKPTPIDNVEKEVIDNSSEEASKPTEELSKPTEELSEPTEAISEPTEVHKEIDSSKQTDDSVKEDDSLKNSTVIKEYSQLCFDNCLYTFSKVLKKVDGSQLVYQGEVTNCVDYLMTPIINETANSFIKGALFYKWNESLVVEWDETYYLYEYESDVNFEIQEIDYTTEDINSAWTAVFNYIDDIDGVALNDIWLDRDYGALYRAYYMKYGNGASNGISEENVMVFEVNLIFDSDDNEYGEEANTKIILIKDTVSGIWQVDEARLYY